MRIDWLTVIAQIVNFLVLVWLLKRFLYRPVIDAMARREARIESRLEEARRRESEAQAEAETYRERSAELDRQRERSLENAREAAAAEKRDLVEEARAEVAGLRARWADQLAREREEFRRDLATGLAAAVVDASRGALRDLADAELEAQMAKVLVRRLGELSEEERQALTRSAEPLRIACSFELGDDARQLISAALGEDCRLEFTRDPQLLFGITISSADRRVEWSASGYLTELETRLDALLAAATAERQESS